MGPYRARDGEGRVGWLMVAAAARPCFWGTHYLGSLPMTMTGDTRRTGVMHVCVCMYTCMYVWMSVCMNACMYLCEHVLCLLLVFKYQSPRYILDPPLRLTAFPYFICNTTCMRVCVWYPSIYLVVMVPMAALLLAGLHSTPVAEPPARIVVFLVVPFFFCDAGSSAGIILISQKISSSPNFTWHPSPVSFI